MKEKLSEKFINAIMKEYQETGYINVYFIGEQGSGKTNLLIQIYIKICEKLNINPNLNNFDFNTKILTEKGINLIETFRDSDLYHYKVKTFINYDNNERKKGFCEYSIRRL